MLEPSYVGLWMNTVWNAPLKSIRVNNQWLLSSFHAGGDGPAAVSTLWYGQDKRGALRSECWDMVWLSSVPLFLLQEEPETEPGHTCDLLLPMGHVTTRGSSWRIMCKCHLAVVQGCAFFFSGFSSGGCCPVFIMRYFPWQAKEINIWVNIR